MDTFQPVLVLSEFYEIFLKVILCINQTLLQILHEHSISEIQKVLKISQGVELSI